MSYLSWWACPRRGRPWASRPPRPPPPRRGLRRPRPIPVPKSWLRPRGPPCWGVLGLPRSPWGPPRPLSLFPARTISCLSSGPSQSPPFPLFLPSFVLPSGRTTPQLLIHTEMNFPSESLPPGDRESGEADSRSTDPLSLALCRSSEDGTWVGLQVGPAAGSLSLLSSFLQ